MTTFPDHLRPRPLEIACGLAIDGESHAAPLAPGGHARMRDAVEDAVRGALLRAPCVVSFSGGRDSAAVLATAAAVARREGLSLPIPVTHRFPGAPATHEDRWQEDIVRHLGLDDWVRLRFSHELDSVGPVARKVLRRHGVLWPFNAHFHVPVFEQAAGGSVLTGVGGDELLAPQQWRGAQAVLAGHARPRPRHLLTVGLALAPHRIRREVLTRRRELAWPWIRPEVAEAVNRQRAEWTARTPLRWSAAVDWWWRSRSRAVLCETLALLAADADAHLVQPFLEPAVLGAAARQFGVRGPARRSAAMRAVFGDLLPETVPARRSKASFDEAFFSDHSRAFAASWNGEDVDPSLVDADRLAEVWHATNPDPRSFSLLQSTWRSADRRTPQGRVVDGAQDGNWLR